MLIADVEARLVAMLREAGVAPGAVTATDVPTIVEVFRRFAALPVDDAAPARDDGDGILAQFGTYTFRGTREFSCDTDALGSGVLWSFGMALDEFFAEVAALPGRHWALTGSAAPQDLVIELEQV